jgi:hypothetical protein
MSNEARGAGLASLGKGVARTKAEKIQMCIRKSWQEFWSRKYVKKCLHATNKLLPFLILKNVLLTFTQNFLYCIIVKLSSILINIQDS